ncbi:MAG: phosphoglycolate phosphatase [Methanolinea sp.]|nr:phosphoglycolate phosphatase [Methanolinea sp.]
MDGFWGLVTDVDGTITDDRRHIDTRAIDAMRRLTDEGICVILASGNTSCFMDAISKMIGTGGVYIGENGGIIRQGWNHDLEILGDGTPSRIALWDLVRACRARGIAIEHYSLPYRFVDVAFARTVPASLAREILHDHPVMVLDTGYAIHIHPPGVSKGIAFSRLCQLLGREPGDFIAVGDGENDVDLLERAGVGVAVANAHPGLKRAADVVTEKEFGEGFLEALNRYFPISGRDNGQQRCNP